MHTIMKNLLQTNNVNLVLDIIPHTNMFMSINYTLFQPLITAMGRNLTVFLLIPAAWQVLTTSVTFLYDSGASSITNFGDATLMEIPRPSNFVSTSL